METEEQTKSRDKAKLAQVTVSIEGGEAQHKTVPAGETQVSQLKVELGAAAESVLWLVHGHTRKPLDNSESIDVESGMHFEAIGGGGIS